MTPTRLRECLAVLDWTQRGLARLLNRHEGTVRQWARGTVSIPEDVAQWLNTLTRVHEENPPPFRTRETDSYTFGVGTLIFNIFRIDWVKDQAHESFVGTVVANNAPCALLAAYVKFDITKNGEQAKLIARRVSDNQ